MRGNEALRYEMDFKRKYRTLYSLLGYFTAAIDEDPPDLELMYEECILLYCRLYNCDQVSKTIMEIESASLENDPKLYEIVGSITNIYMKNQEYVLKWLQQISGLLRAELNNKIREDTT